MYNKQVVAALIIGFFALPLAGCTGAAARQTTAPEPRQTERATAGQESAAAMAAFNALVGKEGVRAAELLSQMDRSIRLVSRNEAAAMIVSVEAEQKRDLPLMEKLLSEEGLQRKIDNVYRTGLDLGKAEGITDADLRGALTQLKGGGYRVETAEGMYFPVIDYSVYKQYRGLATADVAAYIDLMATESDHTPAKDNALVIGWDEVVRRALAQEGFITIYEDSPRFGDVKNLYNRYLYFVFYGANNTPLFDYDSKVMNSEAKAAYAAAASGGDSRLTVSLRGYMAVLTKSSYRLNAEVEEYRKQAVKDLQG